MDLEVAGFGKTWQHRRVYSNQLSSSGDQGSGYNWLVESWPYLVQVGGGSLAMVQGTTKSLWFDPSGSGYVGRYGALATLTHDTVNQVFVLAMPDGSLQTFNDFTQTTNPAGLLKSQQTPGGQLTTVTSYVSRRVGEIQRSITQNGVNHKYSILNTFNNDNQVTGILLRTQVNGGAWTSIRNVVYEYHPGGDGFGTLGDLKRVRVQVPATGGGFTDVQVSYYRYYVAGESAGFVHGLKYVVKPGTYANMVAAGLDPTSVSNATLAQSADQYLQYDSYQRVTLESLDSGSRTYTFSFTASSNAPGYNNWAMKTVETRPDSSTNTVYTNYIGSILLKQLQSGSNSWTTYNQYDSSGKLILTANPSAVAGFNDSSATLNVTLNSASGFIKLTDYYTSTANGGAPGYLWRSKIQQGSGGTPVVLTAYTYTSVTAGTSTVYPVASMVNYRNADGSGAITTSYAYTYYSGTTQVQQRTTTLPAISTAQNGSGTSATTSEYYDSLGQLTWRMDERGFITQFVYDNPTGALAQRVDDVNTSQASGVPSGWSTPAGGGLNLVTDYQFDNLGRSTQQLGPWHTVDLGGTATSVRRASWTVYQDTAYQQVTAQGYATGSSPNYSFTVINPVMITISDAAGKVVQQISATRSSTSGAPSASDSYPQSSYVRWKTTQYTDCCRPASERTYFAIPSSGTGTAGTNYNETDYGYDSLKRQNMVTSPGGTITFQVFDTRSNAIAKYVGTNDAGATQSDPTGGGASVNNMVLVSEYQYDNGQGGGDNYLTATTEHVGATTTRVTTVQNDWRGRRVAIQGPVDYFLANTFDNLDRVVEGDRYNTSASGNLIARSQTSFDDLGRVYATTTFGVDPSSGTVGNALVSQKWYDAAGNLTKDLPAGSQVFSKKTYDSLGRVTTTYNGYGSDSTYAATQSTSGNTVLEQFELIFDPASNTIQATNRLRYHNVSPTQTGPLGTPGTQPYARATTIANYPDPIGRLIATVNYGTNGGAALTRSATVPTDSSTVLVTRTTFNSRGEASQTTDPLGRVDQYTFDDAGRQSMVIENYVDGNPTTGTPDQDRTTSWTYTGDDLVASITLAALSTSNQVTQYAYGSTLGDSSIASSLLKRLEISADSQNGNDQVAFAYNRQGQVVTRTEPTGTVHSYVYDGLGRLTEDAVTTLGAGVDSSIRRIETAYEVRGLKASITSYDNPTVGQGNVVNQVQFTYNTFAQPVSEAQEHDGSVTSATPTIQYAYANGSANTIRPTSLTYPSGRVLTYSYGAAGGNDDAASRVTALIDNDGATTLAGYSYLGRGEIVATTASQPQLQFTLANPAGSNDPDTGDIYTGLDRFDRVKDHRWMNSGSGNDLVRIKHGYDAVGNRLYRQDTVAEAQSAAFDELYAVDGLYRIASLLRGTLASGQTSVTGKTFAQGWSLDAPGNWTGYDEDDNGDGTWDLVQSRSANPVNEITAISTSTGPSWAAPSYDAAGNMTTVPQPANPTQAYLVTYDAWNRPIQFSDRVTGATVKVNAYDGRRFRVVYQDYSNGSLIQTRHTYYTADWRAIEERLATGGSVASSSERQFVWGLVGPDDLVLRDRSTANNGTLDERLYALSDPNFNIVAVSNTAGTIQERYTYQAFGLPAVLTPTFAAQAASNFGWETLFAGYRSESSTGLYLIRNRVYQPGLGTWLQRDPMGLADGPNLYAYVGNRPTLMIDPLGLISGCGTWGYTTTVTNTGFISASGTGLGRAYCKLLIAAIVDPQIVTQITKAGFPKTVIGNSFCSSSERCCVVAVLVYNVTVNTKASATGSFTQKVAFGQQVTFTCTVNFGLSVNVTGRTTIGVCVPKSCKCPPFQGVKVINQTINLNGTTDLNQLQDMVNGQVPKG